MTTLAAKNKLWFAFALAVLIHSILLAIKYSVAVPANQLSSQITVQLKKREIKKENAAEEISVQVPEQQIQAPKEIESQETSKVTPTKPVAQDILVTKPNPVEQQPKKLVVQTSSEQFQRLIHRETQNYSDKNPGQVSSFRQTFSDPVEQEYIMDNDSVSAKAQVRRVGVHATLNKDGSRTCFAQILDMLDISAEASYTSKDCTPKKEFDIKLGQPNNG